MLLIWLKILPAKNVASYLQKLRLTLTYLPGIKTIAPKKVIFLWTPLISKPED